jgi:K+-transporting ATPase ATPase C chain
LAIKNKSKEGYRPVIALAFVSLILCGLLFPLVVTGISQAILPYQANGSLAQVNGRTVGSYYIDNGFTIPLFFHPRNESNPATASASGVDPDITLQDALSQIQRIHNATGIPIASLTNIVTSHVERTLWIFGDPYVNVLGLNLALISAYPTVYAQYR